MNEPGHLIRPIRPEDDPHVAAVIRSVMPEFGAGGPGFAIHDPEVDGMYEAYSRPRAGYFVVEHDARIVGGGGVAPLVGSEFETCELRKMYFLPQARGLGIGAALMRRCLRVARGFGYRTCYLETLTGMDGAQRLYEKWGFRPLTKPMGATGHFGCDRWFALEL